MSPALTMIKYGVKLHLSTRTYHHKLSPFECMAVGIGNVLLTTSASYPCIVIWIIITTNRTLSYQCKKGQEPYGQSSCSRLFAIMFALLFPHYFAAVKAIA